MESSGSVKTRVRKDTKRKQFHAGNIFDTIIKKKYKPSTTEALFFLTDEDLYPQDGWTFVFGVTRASLRTIIQSMARHDSAFPKKSTMTNDYDAKNNSGQSLTPSINTAGDSVNTELLKDLHYYSKKQQQSIADI